MPENSWRPDNVYDTDDLAEQLDTLNSLMGDLPDSADLRSYFERGSAGRRRKAAMALTIVWSSTIALHLVSWGIWLVVALTTVAGLHFLRMFWMQPLPTPEPSDDDSADLPYVSLMVSAKNEESVITSLVKRLCDLDYPGDRYDVWVIDDASSDRTPDILDQLALHYPNLNVVHRAPDAGGGKSGALNQVYPLTQGDIIAVFDADAQVPDDLLQRVLPLFRRLKVGAVQVRKATLNGKPGEEFEYPVDNFWVRGQIAEMALDSHLQQQRISMGGIGELRGNGQFVRRAALERCGGWNEQTITDDLDMTLRLHLDQWDIRFLFYPPVYEEGVTTVRSLWHQRSRWAEGGYQRYLDYWRLLGRNRLGLRKTFDLFIFGATQYLLPTAAIPDFLMAIARNTSPIWSPLVALMTMVSFFGMVRGLRQVHHITGSQSANLPDGQNPRRSPWTLLLHAIQGTLYMFHWLPVMASTTARISIRPKRLKWVKTMHQGTGESAISGQ